MVSVRKSHQMSEKSYEQWLDSLDINEQKRAALEALWTDVKNCFTDHDECQTKSFEMVEILAPEAAHSQER